MGKRKATAVTTENESVLAEAQDTVIDDVSSLTASLDESDMVVDEAAAGVAPHPQSATCQGPTAQEFVDAAPKRVHAEVPPPRPVESVSMAYASDLTEEDAAVNVTSSSVMGKTFVSVIIRIRGKPHLAVDGMRVKEAHLGPLGTFSVDSQSPEQQLICKAEAKLELEVGGAVEDITQTIVLNRVQVKNMEGLLMLGDLIKEKMATNRIIQTQLCSGVINGDIVEETKRRIVTFADRIRERGTVVAKKKLMGNVKQGVDKLPNTLTSLKNAGVVYTPIKILDENGVPHVYPDVMDIDATDGMYCVAVEDTLYVTMKPMRTPFPRIAEIMMGAKKAGTLVESLEQMGFVGYKINEANFSRLANTVRWDPTVPITRGQQPSQDEARAALRQFEAKLNETPCIIKTGDFVKNIFSITASMGGDKYHVKLNIDSVQRLGDSYAIVNAVHDPSLSSVVFTSKKPTAPPMVTYEQAQMLSIQQV